MSAVVALCEEGVDRNNNNEEVMVLPHVALCEEGVDRNGNVQLMHLAAEGRPLRRGRG